MKRAVVLGVGNRLMGDDGIGVRIVEALGRSGTRVCGQESGEDGRRENSPETIRFTAGETDIGYCLREIADSDLCIIIDGACTGKEPCSVSAASLKDVFRKMQPARSFHDFDLMHGMKRDGLWKEGILITVEVGFVGFSAELSPLMEERFDEILREVKAIVRSCLFAYGVEVP